MSDTDKQWEKWGAQDPYYGVLSNEKFHRSNFEANRDEFFFRGENFIADTLKTVENAFGAPKKLTRALDFGCGVGRLTIPLARRFTNVTGIDISPSMLREAEVNLRSFGLTNAELFIGDDNLTRLTGEYDYVNSYIVLQHIPVTRGYALIDRILSHVAPEGDAMLHFSTRREIGFFRKIVYWLKSHVPASRYVLNILAGKKPGTPWMEMNEYDLPTVLKIFSRHSMPRVMTKLEYHGRILTVMCMARRQSTSS